MSSASIVEDRGLRAWWSRSERKVVPYAFISPFYILFIVFSVGPLIFALYLSLHRWPGTGPMRHVGLGNYTYLAGDPVFLKSLWNTVYYAIGAFLFILPLALVLGAADQFDADPHQEPLSASATSCRF